MPRAQPGVRLPGIAASLGITERSAHGIVTGLAEAGRIVKLEDGRRNRYQSPGTPAAARTYPGGHPPSAKSWPSWPELAQGCARRRARVPGHVQAAAAY